MDASGLITQLDRWRRPALSFTALLALLATLDGTGVTGTPVADTVDGWFRPGATLLSPASPAFSIWIVIQLGLVAHLMWQWLPANESDPQLRATGWWLAGSLLIYTAWLEASQRHALDATAVLIVALALVLGRTLTVLDRTQRRAPAPGRHEEKRSLPRRPLEILLTDAPFGLFLGWVCLASAPNVTASLMNHGLEPGRRLSEGIAIGILAFVLGLAIVVQGMIGGRTSVSLAMAWGLTWVAVERLTGDNRSLLVGLSAVALAFLVGVTGPISGRRAAARDRRPDQETWA